MRHRYFDRRGHEVSAEQALHRGVLRNGYSLRVPTQLKDNAPRQHFADARNKAAAYRSYVHDLENAWRAGRDEPTGFGSVDPRGSKEGDHCTRDGWRGEWRNPIGGIGDPSGTHAHEQFGSQVGQTCTINGRPGHLKMVGGQLRCVPEKRIDAPNLDGDDDGEMPCHRCGGSGIEPGFKPSGCIEEPTDDDEADRIVRMETQTHHEGPRRFDGKTLDQLRKQHQIQMSKIYDSYSREISEMWCKP
jgi:hypothetical protein